MKRYDGWLCDEEQLDKLMKIEEFLNYIGVETRNPKNDDEIRSYMDILNDVVDYWKTTSDKEKKNVISYIFNGRHGEEPKLIKEYRSKFDDDIND